MLKIKKKVGETPLELLERLRIEKPELKNEKLSYAGRLDPLAEGETLVLVGDENNEYNSHLNYDKEYEATFLVGIETDTGDILGLIKKLDLEFSMSDLDFEEELDNIKKIKKQTYPWFSGRKVDGKKLFDHFKEGNLDIERPELDVKIKEVIFLNQEEVFKKDVFEYVYDSIKKVNGDFRQDEILKKWYEFEKKSPEKFITFSIKIKVSSGTFIRALCDKFSFPCCLLKLNRTKIFN